MAIPGARRPETARSAARAAEIRLEEREHRQIAATFGAAIGHPHAPAPDTGPGPGPGPGPAPDTSSTRRPSAAAEVVIVMGIPGAGKSRLAAEYVDAGYARLNRDERGGSLRVLAAELEAKLAGGVSRVVLDNTYLTRAARSHVLEVAHRHSVGVRCLWLDTPLTQAQVNLVERLLGRFGSLPDPEQIRAAARLEPWLMLPTSQMRALRELEPPAEDEGFAEIERTRFARATAGEGSGAVFVGAAAIGQPGIDQALREAEPDAPHLVFDWAPGRDGGLANILGARYAAV